jgi:heme oxygenase (mycobilin-producing)
VSSCGRVRTTVTGVLVVLRFEAADDVLLAEAQAVLSLLATRPGYQRGQVARAYDQPDLWCLVTEWESVGAYRRALGAFEVKVNATPLLAESMDEPSAFEVLATAPPGGTVRRRASDLAARPADQADPAGEPRS